MKRYFINIVIVMVFFVSLFSSNSIYAADNNAYSVKVGKKITLKTELKKAVWGSSDTSIATVTNKGVVKGVKEGTCTIVATSDGKSELFSVKVIKTKKKNIVEVYNKNMIDWYKHFKDNQVVYLDGIKITYYETTYSDLLNEIKKSSYTCSDYDKNNKMPKANDIITNNFTIRIMNGKKSCAKISFKYTDSRIAKDAIISNVEIDYDAPSSFYYFNTKFKIKNVPDFDSFKTSNLFSEEISWCYEDGKINGKNIVWCYQGFYCSDDILQKENGGYIVYTMYFAFDQSTHKCVYVTMK